MSLVGMILVLVEELVNGIFASLNIFFDGMGIPVTLEPIDIG